MNDPSYVSLLCCSAAYVILVILDLCPTRRRHLRLSREPLVSVSCRRPPLDQSAGLLAQAELSAAAAATAIATEAARSIRRYLPSPTKQQHAGGAGGRRRRKWQGRPQQSHEAPAVVEQDDAPAQAPPAVPRRRGTRHRLRRRRRAPPRLRRRRRLPHADPAPRRPVRGDVAADAGMRARGGGGGSGIGAVDAGAGERVAQHERRGAAVGGVVAAERPPVPVPAGGQGGVHVPHAGAAAAGAALGEVLRRRQQGALLGVRALHAGLPPRLPADVRLLPPAGAQPGGAVGRDEHVRRGAASAGERAAGPGERALRPRLRVVRAALRLPRDVPLPDPLPPQLRRRLRRTGPARPRSVPRRPGPGGAAPPVAQGRAVVRAGPRARRRRGRRRPLLPQVQGALPAAVLRGRALPAHGALRGGAGEDRQPERDVGGLVPRRRAPGHVRRR